MYSKKEFLSLINECTKNEHDFLTICMKVGWKYRYRRCLSDFVILPRLMEGEEHEEDETQDSDEKKKGEKKRKGVQTGDDTADEICEDPDKFRDGVDKIVSLRKGRQDVRGSIQQEDTVLGEWAHKGARGRTIW